MFDQQRLHIPFSQERGEEIPVITGVGVKNDLFGVALTLAPGFVRTAPANR